MIETDFTTTEPETLRLAYRSRFHINLLDITAPQAWDELAEIIKDWIVQRELTRLNAHDSAKTSDIVQKLNGQDNFLINGAYLYGMESSLLVRQVHNPEQETPTCCVVEYVAPDNQVPRKWVSNIGITQVNPTLLIINIRISCADLTEKLEAEPPMASVFAPEFVANCFNIKGVSITSAETQLSTKPIALTQDNLKQFADFVTNDKRDIALVVATNDIKGQMLLDLDKLAELLAGNALVYSYNPNDSALSTLYKQHFPSEDNLFVGKGVVRIYFPHIIRTDADSFRQHPYIRMWDMDKNELELLPANIARTIARSVFKQADEVLIPRDIELKNRYQEIDQLSDLYQTKEPAEDERTGLIKQIAELQKSRTELENQMTAQRNAYQNLQSELNARVSLDADKELRLERVLHMQTLPTKPSEALQLAADLFGDRIIVTPEAHTAATNADNTNIKANEVWCIMRDVYHYLWPAMFGADQQDLQRAFSAQSEYELSLRESKLTNDNPKLKAIREITYEGDSYDITPHIKGKSSKPGQALRVHFARCSKHEKVLIGHCGLHLDTAGTKRKGI